VSGESRAECGGMLTLVGDGPLLLVIESSGFEEILRLDITPVVTLCATFVHTGFRVGPVPDYGTEMGENVRCESRCMREGVVRDTAVRSAGA
jgi:hypothetical protein